MQTNSHGSGIKNLFQIIRSNGQIASSLLQHMPNTNYYWWTYTNMHTHTHSHKSLPTQAWKKIEQKRTTMVQKPNCWKSWCTSMMDVKHEISIGRFPRTDKLYSCCIFGLFSTLFVWYSFGPIKFIDFRRKHESTPFGPFLLLLTMISFMFVLLVNFDIFFQFKSRSVD